MASTKYERLVDDQLLNDAKGDSLITRNKQTARSIHHRSGNTLKHKPLSRQWTDISIHSSVSGDIGVSSRDKRASNFLGGRILQTALTGGFLPQTFKARSTWTPSQGRDPCGKQLSDSKQSALVYGLARALLVYGAPLYRVERRITEAGEGLGVPTAVFCLPSAIIITLGDGSSSQPPRTHFLEANGGFNMGKLQEVDELAVRCANLRLSREPATFGDTDRKDGKVDLPFDHRAESTVKETFDHMVDRERVATFGHISPAVIRKQAQFSSNILPPTGSLSQFEVNGRRPHGAFSHASTAGFNTPHNFQRSGSILATAYLESQKGDGDNNIENGPRIPVIDLQETSPQASAQYLYESDTGLHQPLNVPKVFEYVNSSRPSMAAFMPALAIEESRRPSFNIKLHPSISLPDSPILTRRQLEIPYGGTSDDGDMAMGGELLKKIFDTRPFENYEKNIEIAEEKIRINSSDGIDTNGSSKERTCPQNVDSIDKILEDLDHVVTRRLRRRAVYRGCAFAVQAAMITLLIYRGSLADATLAALLEVLLDLRLFNSPLRGNDMIARFAERAWPGNQAVVDMLMRPLSVLPDNATNHESVLIPLDQDAKDYLFYGVFACYSTFSLASLAQLLPGPLITLGMLELSSSPVAGSVRIFQSFIRALKLGYGLTLGSKLAIWTMSGLNMPLADFGIQSASRKHCPDFQLGIQHLEPWRIAAFIPMNIAVLVALNANTRQWLPMTVASLCAFVVSLSAGSFFSPEISSMIAAFVLGIISNCWARLSNDVAIASVLAGISWLVPGSVGVQSTFGLFQSSSDWTPGATFGMEMITRAMSIAIGLYMANAVIFPIKVKKMETAVEP
ncbi:hypothetical protein BC829DRAFT_487345 [Chytridium lagenaria]|nr:hypothetical protein BC829DRAFT_487345 [Chytridium lagenaria]